MMVLLATVRKQDGRESIDLRAFGKTAMSVLLERAKECDKDAIQLHPILEMAVTGETAKWVLPKAVWEVLLEGPV